MRALGVGLLLLLTVPACSSDSPGPPPEPERLASCTGLGAAPDGGQVTALDDGQLLAVTADGQRTCLIDDVAPTDLAWGPQGDRILLGRERVVFADRTAPATIPSIGSMTLSAPKGTTAVGVTKDGKLFRQTLNGDPPEDITFLAQHDEVAYHPAGIKIVTAGRGHDGTYGIYIATNRGTNHTKFVDAENADRIHHMAFTTDGRWLVFVAEHGNSSHVHMFSVALNALPTQFETERHIESIQTLDETSIAVQEGECSSRTSTVVVGAGAPERVAGPLAGKSTQPVGWLRDHTLVLLARAHGCSGPAELWTWHAGQFDQRASAVDGAAVRSISPEVGDIALDRVGRAPA